MVPGNRITNVGQKSESRSGSRIVAESA